jgi:hypothetical protein
MIVGLMMIPVALINKLIDLSTPAKGHSNQRR